MARNKNPDQKTEWLERPSPMADAPKPLTLEPCPFCGMDMKRIGGNDDHAVHPQSDCWLSRRLINIADWNRRAEVTASRAARGMRLTQEQLMCLGEEWLRAQRLPRSHLAAFLAGARGANAALAAAPAPAEADALRAAQKEIERLTKINAISLENIREAREAMAFVREEIEQHMVGAMPSGEQVMPPFMDEAKVQVEAVAKIAALAAAAGEKDNG